MTKVNSVRIKDGDVIVVTTPFRLHTSGIAEVEEHVAGFFPNNKVLVLSVGVEMAIVGPECRGEKTSGEAGAAGAEAIKQLLGIADQLEKPTVVGAESGLQRTLFDAVGLMARHTPIEELYAKRIAHGAGVMPLRLNEHGTLLAIDGSIYALCREDLEATDWVVVVNRN